MKALNPLLYCILSLVLLFGSCQSTTVFLVRHAEKIEGKDQLNDVGEKRAEKLSRILKDEKIDVIFSSSYDRTRNTAKPFSEFSGLPILEYDARDIPGFAKQLKKDYKGKNILIVGHSNTIPETVRALGFTPSMKQLGHDDYHYLFKLNLENKGSLEELNF